MEHRKILNLLNEASDFKFMKKNIGTWNFVNDHWNANYDVENQIIYDTEVLNSNLCDFKDAYILVEEIATAATGTKVSFKNCEPFTKCIKKIDETTINDAEDLYLVMPMDNSIEYSWNIENNDNAKSFKHKAKLLKNTVAEPVPNQAKLMMCH